MRPFFWRIVFCLTPVLLSAFMAWNAYPDGYKLGVDLSGGTILVYEIDRRKEEARAGDDARGATDLQADTNLLAEALKRRIDPTGTYDIKIRPAGTGGRVEIILPTGGEARAAKAQEAWNTLLAEMKKKWHLPDLEIARGKTHELVDRIQTQVAERTWSEKVFSTPQAWKELIDRAENKWLQLTLDFDPALAQTDPQALARLIALQAGPLPVRPVAAPVLALPLAGSIDAYLRSLKPGQLSQVVQAIKQDLEGTIPEGAVAGWVKEQAWKHLLGDIRKEWKSVTEADLEGIVPDSYAELIGRVEAKGNLLEQAALETLRPLLGAEPIQVNAKDPKALLNSREKIVAFIRDHYGPTPAQVEESVGQVTGQDLGHSRDLTVEEVQRIKDLVTRVGSLEFKILSNQHDDKQAIADAKDQTNNPGSKDDLEQAALRGVPPPGPRMPGSKSQLKRYTIELPHNVKSIVTYGWVELGPQERHQLGLDNAARNDAEIRRKKIWDFVHNRLNQAVQIPEPTAAGESRFLMEGALFLGREVKDRNMPEEEKRKKQYEYFVLARNPEIDPATNEPTPAITGVFLKGAQVRTEGGQPAVSFWFNQQGGELFGNLTGKNIPSGAGGEASQLKRHLAIVLDGRVMSAPTINSRITTIGQITGSFTRKEVDGLVNILRSGALPATLKRQPVSETTIGATLGEDTIREGVRAIAIAFVVVVIFMMVYYRFAGIVASVALFANLLLTVGFMVAVQATFTLPGLAGLVLMLGMAVDANVLIYERFREERDRGASLALAIRNGYDRAFPTIIDTHLSSIFTAIVLYVVGNDQLKGFGVSLTVGLIISLFTSLYMTRLIFDIWLSRGWLHKLSMARLLSKPDFDFMGIRYWCFTFTVLVTVLGVAVFVARLPSDLNIDFVGGTAYGGRLVKPVDMTQLRDLVSEQRQKELLAVASVKQEDKDGHRFQVTYRNPNGKEESHTVLLANVPVGNDPAENEDNVRKRASTLPDSSVEQLFPNIRETDAKGNPLPPDPAGTSRFFNIRTSEKEAELVQTTLDRLLRTETGGKLEPLMKKVHMKVDTSPLEAKKKEIRLAFTQFGTTSPAFASQSFVNTLFNRELERSFGVASKNDLPFQYELAGTGKTQEGGRFQEMRLAFNPELKPDERKKVEDALARTQQAFEARPAPERLENFDSELAAQVRLQAMWAILASWLAIALYLWFRFGSWTFGLAAVLCLIHDLFFTLGIIAFCHYLHGTWLGNLLGLEDFKIDLTAVAALLTLVGYSVNDTIVVFDRIREVRGKNPDLTPEMINDSVNQTLSRTLLTSLTAWLVVFVLYVIGGPGVHLFAFVMVVGVIVGTYSSIYVASPLLLIFGEGTRSQTGLAARAGRPAGAVV